jgi:hypothetical protein
MTTEQLKQNIQALEQQGIEQQEIQSYINSIAGQVNNEAKKPNLLSRIGNALISSEKNFGQTLGQVAANLTGTGKSIEESNKKLFQSGNDLLQLALKQTDQNKRQQILNLSKKQFEQAGVNWQNVLPTILKTNKQIAGEAAGTALDVLSFGTFGKAVQGAKTFGLLRKAPSLAKGTIEAGKKILKQTKPMGILKSVYQTAKQGIKVGLPLGAAYGEVNALQENKNLLQQIGQTAMGSLIGAITGGLGGAGFGGISGGIQNVLTKNTFKQNELVAKILRAKNPKDINAGLEELGKLDITDINNYDDFQKVVKAKISNLLNLVDEKLGENKNIFKLNDLKTTTQVGKKNVVINYVKEAINNLISEFKKANNPVMAEEANQLLQKAKNKGLTLQEINNVARSWGEFGKKAFSKTGEALTSVSALKSENIRRGVKEILRSFDLQGTEKIDKQISRLIRIDNLIQKNIEGINSILARSEKLNLPQRLLGKVRILFNPKNITGRIWGGIPVNNKYFSLSEAETVLNKNLEQLKKLQNYSPNLFIKYLENLREKITGNTSLLKK